MRRVPAHIGLGLALTVLAAAKAPPSGPIWEGESGGHKIVWDNGDITATPTGAKPGPKITLTPPPSAAKEEGMEQVSDFRLLSVVGSYVSMSRHLVARFAGANEAMIGNEFLTADLAAHAEPVKLDRIFTPESLLEALAKDKTVKRAMKAGGRKEPFTTVAELVKFLEDRSVRSGKPDMGDDGAYFPADLLSGFSFHHVEKDRVAVRLHLPPRNGKTGKSTELGLLLPIPPALKAPLADAEAKRHGFLGKDQKSIAKGRTTTIEG